LVCRVWIGLGGIVGLVRYGMVWFGMVRRIGAERSGMSDWRDLAWWGLSGWTGTDRPGSSD